jgi:predicted dienelactone hydrolase
MRATHNRPVLAIASALALCAALAVPAASAATMQATQAAVTVSEGEWRDAQRDRVVPYRLYLPANVAPAPVVIFSHGLGGSRDAAGYLMRMLAQNGFVGVVLQHPGSDSALLAGASGRTGAISQLRGGMDPRAAAARFGDVRFAIDQLAAANRSGPLAGRLDLARIGMSGHSYGALTTLVSVGQRLGPVGDRFRDPRIRAAIVYSPNAPRNQEPATALGAIATPILHFTGTADRTPFDLEASPEGRQIPFRTIDRADQFLVVLEGGDHMIFSGRVQAAGGMTEAQQAQTDAIQRETLTFWRAYLLGDAQALAALCDLPARVRPVATGAVKATRCPGAR